MENRKKLISEISDMFNRDTQRNIFKNYIEYVRFPFFKNFEKDIKINFTFPIIFIVGQNGSGKSSLLQALYGAPKGYSLGKYWFTTALDPIKDLENNRHCLIYSYKSEYSKQEVEVLKTRIHRQNNPDYWEPSEPLKKYNMVKPKDYDTREVSKSKDRWNQLNKKVYHMDFRYILSAYDKYFYFTPLRKTKNLNKKQDFIRKYSKKLKEAFSFGKEIKYYERKIKKPIKLANNEVNIINTILGKQYTEILISEHNLYENNEGFTILFVTEHKNRYSEAYAGSGESAVVKLVNEIVNSEAYSLILLDEPETSLHPLAQKKLIEFILEQVKIKKLQVIVSTHSPDIIEDMPKEAIKLLYENPDSGKINVMENVYFENAFSFIGRTLSDKKIILVEDKLAKFIVEAVLKDINEEDFFEVKYFPGGESRLKQEFWLVYSKEEDKKHFIILDGDQRKEKIEVKNLSDSDKSVENLKNLVKNITNEDIKFATDGSGNELQKIDLMLKYIEYHNKNVFYLPKNIPEEIIWDDEVVKKSDFKDDEKKNIFSKKNYKEKFKLYVEYDIGESDTYSIEVAQKKFIKRWIDKKNKDYDEVKETLISIKES